MISFNVAGMRKKLGSKLEIVVPGHKQSFAWKGGIIDAPLIAHGNFSAVYRIPTGVLIKTPRGDLSKRFISQMGSSWWRRLLRLNDKHIPQLKYLGKTDPPIVPDMRKFDHYDLFFSPFYKKPSPSDSAYATAQFLAETYREWQQTVFPDLCFSLEQLYQPLGYDLEGLDYTGTGVVQKANLFRKSFIQYLKQKSTNQFQIQSIIQSLERIDKFLEQKTKLQEDGRFALDFDRFPLKNLAIDERGNLVLLDIVYPMPITDCRKFMTEYVPKEISSEQEHFWEQVLSQFED